MKEFGYKSKVWFETILSAELGEITVLMNRQHPSQQKFLDLLGELEFDSAYAIHACAPPRLVEYGVSLATRAGGSPLYLVMSHLLAHCSLHQ